MITKLNFTDHTIKSYAIRKLTPPECFRLMGVRQNRDRVFCLSMCRDVAFDYQFPEAFPLQTRLEDVLDEEVSERYFLKDDAVQKFLQANDTDTALFLQFDLPPTHEAAMFLKTLLQIEMKKWDGWHKSITDCEKHLKMLSVTIMYEQFKQSPDWMNKFWYGFADLFKENMERKPNL